MPDHQTQRTPKAERTRSGARARRPSFFKNLRGFSFVEIMVTILILTIGILGCLIYYSNSVSSAEIARDMTVATTHASTLLEEMHSRATLTDISGEDWPAWAAANGLNTLSNQSVTVTTAALAPNALDISATVAWTRKSKNLNVSLDTVIKK